MTYLTAIKAPVRITRTIALPSLRSRSLAIQVARKMVLWACINTLIITVIGYVFVSQRVEQRTLAYLSGYLTERLRAESQVFQAGQANLDNFRARFLALYTDPSVVPNPDISAFFEPRADGTLRLKKRFYTGTTDADGMSRKWVTGRIAKTRAHSNDFDRRMIVSYRLVSELGPAWNGAFANLYTTSPEGGGSIYWPGVPWGDIAPASKPDPTVPVPTWKPLYFDTVAKRWNVTYQIPIYHKGRPVLYVGEDIMLDDLISRLIWDHPAGAYNVIIGKGGDLVAQAARMRDLKHSVRGPKISSLGDRDLESIYKSIAEDARKSGNHQGVRIVENSEVDAYVCYGQIKGPGWWFVTVYPRALVLESAHEAANGLLLLGLGSFAIMTLIVLWVLRERVGRPISQMRVASERVSCGDYEAVADGSVRLPEDEDNEIGLFAQSFKGMANKVRDTRQYLEDTVLKRTMELQLANEELQKLSFKDSLTSAFNRRSFDRDLGEAIRTAGENGEVTALLLCDVDHFKLYNDSYGHLAGDQVLKLVAEAVAQSAPAGRLYRYGGEELALLITAPDLGECRSIASAAVEAVSELAIPHRMSPHGVVTISAGLMPITSERRDAGEVIAAADDLLYCAKRLGRNRLVDSQSVTGAKRKHSRAA